MDRGTQSAGQRTDRAAVCNAAGPLGKGNAPGRIDSIAAANHFLEMCFSPGVGTAFHGGTSQGAQCPRRLDPEQRLEEILSVRAGRQVGDDHTVSWDGNPGACHAKKCARVFAVRRWKSNEDWMARTGYASAAAICACVIASTPASVASPSGLRPPGLTDKHRDPKAKSNPNIMCPHITLEETMEPDISILRKTDISTLR